MVGTAVHGQGRGAAKGFATATSNSRVYRYEGLGMLLAIYALALALIAGTVLWFSVSRWWHAAIVALLWIPLFTPVAWWLIGDVSRYLPARTFLEGPERQEQVALTSIFSSVVVSLVLAAALQCLLRWAWAQLKENR